MLLLGGHRQIVRLPSGLASQGLDVGRGELDRQRRIQHDHRDAAVNVLGGDLESVRGVRVDPNVVFWSP